MLEQKIEAAVAAYTAALQSDHPKDLVIALKEERDRLVKEKEAVRQERAALESQPSGAATSFVAALVGVYGLDVCTCTGLSTPPKAAICTALSSEYARLLTVAACFALDPDLFLPVVELAGWGLVLFL